MAVPQHQVHGFRQFLTDWLYQKLGKIALGFKSVSCLRLIIQMSFQVWLNLFLVTSKATQKLEITRFIHLPTVLC